MNDSATAHSATEILRQLMKRTLEYDFTVWVWGDAIAIDGLLDAGELLHDERPATHCLAFFQAWARRTLTWTDHLTPGAALLRLYQHSGTEALLDAALRLAAHLEAAPRSPRYDVPLYRPDINIYRHNVWVDTIYHEPAFFCRLAALTDNPRWYDVGLEIWHSHVRALSSSNGPFLAHSIDTGARALKGYGWGRGQGWALLGMVDTLSMFPQAHAGYGAARDGMCSLAAQVLALQDAGGMWHTLIHDRESYLESSTAAFFGAAFTRGVRLGLLDSRYAAAAERAWQATTSRIDVDGSFWGVSGFTHAGIAPDDVISMYKTLPTETNVWGQGSALRFAAERIRSGLDERSIQ